MGIALEDCAADGDGESDVDRFRAVGLSMGISGAGGLAESAQHETSGDDLSLILPFIL